MLTLQGTIQNVLLTPVGTSKEGEQYGGQHKVQIMAEERLKNGEKRLSLFTLGCDDPEPYKKLNGKSVAVPVGAFARGNAIQFYIVKGSVPSPVPGVGGQA